MAVVVWLPINGYGRWFHLRIGLFSADLSPLKIEVTEVTGASLEHELAPGRYYLAVGYFGDTGFVGNHDVQGYYRMSVRW